MARRALLVLPLLLLPTALPAGAHPYLAERAVEIGDARALPWNGATDFGLVADYDVATRLVPDTLALLTPTTPPLVRYEILRRAALYLSPRFSTLEAALPLRLKLGRRLRDRVNDPNAPPRLRALARFDAGCFEALCGRDRTLASGRDGYAQAAQALPDLPEAAAEVSYVLARIAPASQADPHTQAALDGAQEGTLLAVNILRDWDHEYPTLEALRAELHKSVTMDAWIPDYPQPPPVPGADPDARQEVVLLVPAALSVRKADDGALAVGWVTTAPEAVRVAVGKRMVLGTRIDESVWAGGKHLEGHDSETLLSGEPLWDADSTSFLRDLPATGPLVLRATVRVFETDIPDQHLWSPTGGRYRVLWERTYEVPLR